MFDYDPGNACNALMIVQSWMITGLRLCCVKCTVVDVTAGLYIPNNALCFRPPDRDHANVNLFKDPIGVVAIYTCYPGYYFPAGGTIRSTLCLEEVWSHNVPDCERTSSLLCNEALQFH